MKIYKEGLDVLSTALVVSPVKHLRLEYNPLERAPKRAPPKVEEKSENGDADEAEGEAGAGDAVAAEASAAEAEEEDSSEEDDEEEDEEEEAVEEEEEEIIDPNEDLSLKFAKLFELQLISLWLRGNKITPECMLQPHPNSLFPRCQNIWAYFPLWVSDRISVVSAFQVVNSYARN